MWLPSLRKKLRTQPTWSGASPFSMRDSPTAGCHREWLLKSRSTSHTRAIGASITAERRTRIIASSKLLLQRIERGLEHPLADLLGELVLALRSAVELGPPFDEGPIAVRDRRELERGDVVLHPHGALEDRVAALVVVVRQREELLPDDAAVAQAEVR